jgi:RNA polymerase sigma factor (sigma-70 family)
MSRDHDIGELVARALGGDELAWSALVDRYIPLVLAVARSYRLGVHDIEDVNATIWLRLVEHLRDLRQPRALPKWIVTTTRNECVRLLRSRQRTTPVDPASLQDHETEACTDDVDAKLMRLERQQILRDAFAELSEHEQRLMRLLVVDPPVKYAEISRRLGIPMGSIGPTRARCLQKLRDMPGGHGLVRAG